jgi:pentatricopeptide repeat protein
LRKHAKFKCFFFGQLCAKKNKIAMARRSVTSDKAKKGMTGVCMAQLTWRIVAFVSALSAANAFHSTIPGPYLESCTIFSKCRGSFIGQGQKNHRQPCQNALLALRGNAGAAEEGLKRPISRPIPAVDASVSPAPPKKSMFKVVKRADGSKPAAGKAGQDKGTGTRKVPAAGEGAPPSTVSDYNKEISRLGKTGQWQDAIDTLQVMQGKGLKPTVVSYNTALNVLAKNGQWQEALDMFDRVFRGDNSLKPDSFSYNAVLTACAKGNLVKRAFELFEEMEKGGVVANEFTYNSLMNACERSGTRFTCFTGAKVRILTQKALLEKPGKAIEVFEDMQVITC